MKSAIEELFGGNFGKIDFLKPTENQSRLMCDIGKYEKIVAAFLQDHPEAAEAFQNFKELTGEYNSDNAIVFYKEGFRNGFRLAVDAMQED